MAIAAFVERDLTTADDETVVTAADAVRALEGFLSRHPHVLIGSVMFVPGDHDTPEIPDAAAEMLFDVLSHMAIGDPVFLRRLANELSD